MKHEQIPINPELITWARDRAGYSVPDAEAYFKKISEWEEGKSFPSYSQLENMADKFKIPVAVLFFPSPPDIPSIAETFRTLPETEFAILPSKIRLLLRKAKAYQISVKELTDGQNPSKNQLIKNHALNKTKSISVFANEIREALGISLEEQLSWSNEEFALKKYRNLFSDGGIFVFKDAFRTDEYSGFCLYDKEYPLIYINNTNTKNRQIFTLFHELAHLLFHTSGLDLLSDGFIDRLPPNEKKIEIICNKFAAEFLLPDAVFSKYLSSSSTPEELAIEMSDKFHVSRELVYRKFLDRELITSSQYKLKAREWSKQKGKKKGKTSSGDYYNNVSAYLGKPYMTLAFTRYFQDRITDTQLADYLDVSHKSLDELEARFMRGTG